MCVCVCGEMSKGLLYNLASKSLITTAVNLTKMRGLRLMANGNSGELCAATCRQARRCEFPEKELALCSVTDKTTLHTKHEERSLWSSSLMEYNL